MRRGLISWMVAGAMALALPVLASLDGMSDSGETSLAGSSASASWGTSLGFAEHLVTLGDSGEPTVGVTAANNIFFRAISGVLRSTDNGTSWGLVNVPLLGTFDPMLWVDSVTSRVFVDDLLIACSYLSFSDNEGLTWQPLGNRPYPLACGTPVNDHQKVVSGPWVPGTPRDVGLYPRAVFYCYSGVVYSACSLSPDGGLTWEPAVPTSAIVGSSLLPTMDNACGGLHGHPHIADDGTIYLPHYNCNGGVGFSVSEDEGLTWQTKTASWPPTDGDNDPDVDSTPNGRVWMAYVARTSSGGTTLSVPYVAYSDNKGDTMSTLAVDLGSTGVKTATFPAVTAGDDGRLAVSFLGTTASGGNAGAEGVGSSAIWHAYVSVTYDAGSSWTTTQVSSDPVQRGTICMSGTACGSDRNLLDFIDMTHDVYGSVIMAFADGCVSSACTGSGGTPSDSRDAVGVIVRQNGGDTLLSAWDGQL